MKYLYLGITLVVPLIIVATLLYKEPMLEKKTMPADRPADSNVASATKTDSSMQAPISLQSSKTEQEVFQEILEEAEKNLPTKTSMQSLHAKDIHEIPLPIQKAGISLGKIAEAVEQDNSLAPKAIAFYESCAKQSALLSSVRALCYSNAKNLAEQARIDIPNFDEFVPHAIRRLAQQIE